MNNFKINKAFDWYRKTDPAKYQDLLPKYWNAIKYDIQDILKLNNTGLCDICIHSNEKKDIKEFYGITFPYGLVIQIDNMSSEIGTFRVIYKGAELLDIALRTFSGDLSLKVFLPRVDQHPSNPNSTEGVVLKLSDDKFDVPRGIITSLADQSTLAIFYKTMALLHKKAVIYKIKTKQMDEAAKAEEKEQKYQRDKRRAARHEYVAKEYVALPLTSEDILKEFPKLSEEKPKESIYNFFKKFF